MDFTKIIQRFRVKQNILETAAFPLFEVLHYKM